ncbi:MAG: hypothetical protein ABIR68_09215 [Ilumatobacteraceae bacterium]
MTVSIPPTRRRPLSPRQAATVLAERDPVIARMLSEIGPPSFPAPTETHFATLVRSIVYQQLAGAAAAAIHRRLIAVLDGDVTPERVLATDPLLLRGAGLSGNKLTSLLDLAGKVVDATVVLDRRLAWLSDEDVVARLTTVRGIGRWSAEMFMMFQLRRLDVWPTTAAGRGPTLSSGPIPAPDPPAGTGPRWRTCRTRFPLQRR